MITENPREPFSQSTGDQPAVVTCVWMLSRDPIVIWAIQYVGSGPLAMDGPWKGRKVRFVNQLLDS